MRSRHPARIAATAAGLVKYDTGAKCYMGHASPRYTKSGKCCECEAIRLAKIYRADPDRIIQRNLTWHENNKEKRRLAREARDARTHELRTNQMRLWRGRNREKVNEAATRFRKANPEAHRQHVRNRRARKRGAEGSHTTQDIAQLLEAQRGKCAICFVSIRRKRHIDHIVPLSAGGTNWISNIQLLCQPCNQKKWAKMPYVYALEIGRLL